MAGLGMVASWGLGVLVALYTVIALVKARRGYRRGGVSIVGLSKWCSLFTIGVVTATTVSQVTSSQVTSSQVKSTWLALRGGAVECSRVNRAAGTTVSFLVNCWATAGTESYWVVW